MNPPKPERGLPVGRFLLGKGRILVWVPADEARRLPASVHLLPGQTPGSRWAGGSGRYLRKSGKVETKRHVGDRPR